MSGIGRGKVHVYTGDGKGKTTAALGLAMRARGKGLRVLLVQFLKGKGEFGEVLSARKLGIAVEQFGTGRMLTADDITDDDRKEAIRALGYAKDSISSKRFDMVVLDEINVAISLGLVPLEAVREIISTRPENVEIILTGRGAPDELIAMADYATNMTKLKHPYELGEQARPGIEY